MILVPIRFQEHRCQIGAFQEITRTFGISPKSVITGMFVTRRPRGAKPQFKGAHGLAGHTLSWFRLRLDGYAPKSVDKSITCPKVGGDREEWLPDHVYGRPTVHHLQTDSIKSTEAPLDLYVRILVVEFRTHHTIM
jgi:hypothetical protein